jgi:hypothetical protein
VMFTVLQVLLSLVTDFLLGWFTRILKADS